MPAFGRVFLALALLLLPAELARATAIEDANAAVVAARSGKYDEAIELFTRAINSDELSLTGRAQAYAYRGIAKATSGDYEGAQQDLNFAVALDSDYNADAYAYRGYFALVQGDAAKGAADLAKSAGLKIWAYNAIWLHLARLRAGVSDNDVVSLKNNAATIEVARGADGSPGLSRWPGPVIKFLLGQMKPEEMTAAAEQGDPQRLAERVCDADFYLAQYRVAHNDSAAAKPLFERAAEKCPFASFERMGATAELMRLK